MHKVVQCTPVHNAYMLLSNLICSVVRGMENAALWLFLVEHNRVIFLEIACSVAETILFRLLAKVVI